jgi:hypothetical protein
MYSKSNAEGGKYMRRNIIIILAVLFLVLFNNNFNKPAYGEGLEDEYIKNMKKDILILMMAYPEYVKDILKAEDKVYLVMKSGNKILYDDKRNKTTDEKENNPDLQDMLEQAYPIKDISEIMPKDFDPGRVRVYSLLREVYGGSEGDIRKNLVLVNVGRRYQFNGSNNAAKSLQNAMNGILASSHEKPKIGGFIYPISGTFNYRRISGTGRLSPHAFGIAIDLKSDRKDYWKWASREEGKLRLNSYPREIVRCFENNNFIWGGKWSHFDILHFEYRPEIMLKARYFGNMNYDESKSWYEGVPKDMEEVKSKIEFIDSKI